MRNACTAILAVAVMAALAVPEALAQKQRGPGKGMPKYDPASEVTVKGTVEKVVEHTSPMGWKGTHFTLKSEKNETLTVHLGPSAFLEEEGFKLAPGDEVEVTGSKLNYDGEDALVARMVKKGDKTLTLRNAQGIPQWSKSRRY